MSYDVTGLRIKNTILNHTCHIERSEISVTSLQNGLADSSLRIRMTEAFGRRPSTHLSVPISPISVICVPIRVAVGHQRIFIVNCQLSIVN